ncbi:hypothetical protein BDZ94DRAFT_1246332 [Collybia nuda]|uniref:DUF6534 domain-containing protein n=1 Tax=Collybia nuda TaxID=64659 RepID=A0A9P6CJ18_9AGAR|nr:hypothetical protein BDZ94DRAFT_1246332 [Collybia nuda]
MRLPGVPSDIALLNGPMLLGYLFSYGLLGVLVVQLFLYHLNFPNDKRWIRYFVWSAFFVEVIMTMLATIGAWTSFASGWGDLDVLARLNWSFFILPGLSGMIATAVHGFFCWRIRVLTRGIVLPAVIIVVSAVQCVVAFYVGARAFLNPLSEISELSNFVTVWLGGSAVCDVLITITMVTLLFRANSRSTFKETHSTLRKLIKLTVETGMTTAAGAITELILFLIFPHNNMHFIVFLFLAKLYSNTLLATLNSRVIITHGSTHSYRASKPTALWEDEVRPATGGSSMNKVSVQPQPGVRITTTSTTDRTEELGMVVLDNGSQNKTDPDDIFAVQSSKTHFGQSRDDLSVINRV